jgi:predicted kinase
MGITGSGQDTMVTEDFLDFEQVNARFNQMGSVAVT